MIKIVGAVILILIVFISGKHDKKVKTHYKKIYDDAQTQMQEFSDCMKNNKIINGKGAKNVK